MTREWTGFANSLGGSLLGRSALLRPSFGALFQNLFTYLGWTDPANFLNRTAAVLVSVSEHPWFTPIAIASIAFAVGVWLDYVLKVLARNEEQAKEKRKWELLKRIDNMIYRLSDLSRGVSDYGVYAEYVSLKAAIEAEGVTFPKATPSSREGVKIISNYLDVLSVFLRHNNLDKARIAHQLFSSSEASEPFRGLWSKGTSGS